MDLIVDTVNLTRISTIELLENTLKQPKVDIAKIYAAIKVNELKKCYILVSREKIYIKSQVKMKFVANSVFPQNDESRSYRARLPATALPLGCKVEYPERWKGHRLPLIAIKAAGRLGNVMGEYLHLVVRDAKDLRSASVANGRVQ